MPRPPLSQPGPWKSGLLECAAAQREAHDCLSSLPGDSLAPPEVDFDRLLASLKDLSELVVDGDTQVTPMPGGARLHVLEPIPLKLYRNGLMMFDGPFRPFRDPSTQVGVVGRGDRPLWWPCPAFPDH